MTFSLQDTVPEYLVGILSKEHAIAIAAKNVERVNRIACRSG
jgi:hypothetical protein